jgi:protein-ribulosamine 3-kinase
MPKKSQSGDVGRRMFEGTFQSECAFASYCPNHVPKPIAFGEYAAEPDTWFYLCDYHDMVDELPGVKALLPIITKIHKESMGKSPKNGMYGFPVPTHLANIPNDNTWQRSWETWYTQAMEAMFQFERETHGKDDELETLFKEIKDKVIPRLLRPLETGGRSIEPCLIHSDLWPGNCMPDADTNQIILFDSCGYWGHNESELGPWRAPRYRLGRPYMKEYQKIMGMSEPHADWDDRNALYAL